MGLRSEEHMRLVPPNSVKPLWLLTERGIFSLQTLLFSPSKQWRRRGEGGRDSGRDIGMVTIPIRYRA